eukprot:3934838-Rhodomonas_salina.2
MSGVGGQGGTTPPREHTGGGRPGLERSSRASEPALPMRGPASVPAPPRIARIAPADARGNAWEGVGNA